MLLLKSLQTAELPELKAPAVPVVSCAKLRFDGDPIVTIDGGGATGKSTIAGMLASRIEGALIIDSGLWFRSLGLICQRLNIAVDNESAVSSLLSKLTFFPPQREDRREMVVVFSNEQRQSTFVFSSEHLASTVAEQAAKRLGQDAQVRTMLKIQQRDLAQGGCITAGRAQGSELFGDDFAEYSKQPVVRVFLWAEAAKRAARRVAQRPQTAEGTPEELFARELASLQDRDNHDANRSTGRLLTPAEAQAHNYLVYDAGVLGAQEIVEKIVTELRKRRLLY